MGCSLLPCMKETQNSIEHKTLKLNPSIESSYSNLEEKDISTYHLKSYDFSLAIKNIKADLPKRKSNSDYPLVHSYLLEGAKYRHKQSNKSFNNFSNKSIQTFKHLIDEKSDLLLSNPHQLKYKSNGIKRFKSCFLKLRILLLGFKDIGKTNLGLKLMFNTLSLEEKHLAKPIRMTREIEYHNFMIEFLIDIDDFKDPKSFYEGYDLVLFTFDTNVFSSFTNLVSNIYNYSNNAQAYFLVGIKDYRTKDNTKVILNRLIKSADRLPKRWEAFSVENKIPYFEICLLSNENVDCLLESILRFSIYSL